MKEEIKPEKARASIDSMKVIAKLEKQIGQMFVDLAAKDVYIESANNRIDELEQAVDKLGNNQNGAQKQTKSGKGELTREKGSADVSTA